MNGTLLATTLTAAALSGTPTISGATTPAITLSTTAPQTRWLPVAAGRIGYDDTGGDGPLVLAIPGMGDLRSEYRLLRPALQAAGFRVVTMDVRGFGDSSASWDDYSAHAVGNDALALLQYLNAGPAIILGNSFAAGSALWAAHDAPTHVRGVVLLSPIVRDAPMSWSSRALIALGFAGPWRVAFWAMYWDSLFPTHKPADQSQARAALVRNLNEPGRMAALHKMLELSKADTQAMLPLSRVPALVIMGTRDPDYADARAEAQWLAPQIAAQTLIIEGAGHYPHAEMPEQVAPAVMSFIGHL